MRRVVLVMAFFMFAGFSIGQTSNDIDSLLKAASGQNDSVKYAALIKVAYMYSRKGLLDSAFYYNDIVLKYAKRNKDSKQLCEAYLAIAGTYIRKSNFDQALENLFAGLKIAEKEGYNKYIGRAKMDIGFIYRSQNKMQESLRYLQEAEQPVLVERDTTGLINLYCNLGTSTGLNGDTVKAMQYLQRAYMLSDQILLSSTLPPGKKEYIVKLKLVNIYSTINLKRDTAGLAAILEKTYLVKNDIDTGANLYQKFEIRIILANIYLRLRKYTKALNSGEEAIDIYKSIGTADNNQLRDVYWVIGSAAASLNDYKKAYTNMELFRQYNDSLFDSNKLDAIHSVEARYETEKKEQKIASLNKEKKAQKNLVIISIAGLLLVIGLLIVTVRAKRLQKKLLKKENEAQRLELAQRMAELEQTALRAQMNPHFIFNCLNSVQRYVIGNDVEGVNRYLTTFANLIRQTLENSGKPLIPLKDEIRYLETYIKMEQLRSNNKFDYNINIGPEVDQSDTFIPNMIVQPFVENSILHGITNTKGIKGMIRLDISKGNKLTCIVDDNGGGINSMNMLRQAEEDSHVSMGRAITEKRIEMYNSIHKDKIELQVTDKSEAGSAEPGTRVTLRFPLSN